MFYISLLATIIWFCIKQLFWSRFFHAMSVFETDNNWFVWKSHDKEQRQHYLNDKILASVPRHYWKMLSYLQTINVLESLQGEIIIINRDKSLKAGNKEPGFIQFKFHSKQRLTTVLCISWVWGFLERIGVKILCHFKSDQSSAISKTDFAKLLNFIFMC